MVSGSEGHANGKNHSIEGCCRGVVRSLPRTRLVVYPRQAPGNEYKVAGMCYAGQALTMTGDESVQARQTVRDHAFYLGLLYGTWGAINIATSDRNAQGVRDAAKQFYATAMELAAFIDQEEPERSPPR